MDGITVIINTRNESENIEGVVLSAKNLTDKVIVVDMESTDNTVEIARKTGAEVLSVKPANYVEPAREYAIRQSKTDWVFILDADERIDGNLVSEIKSAVRNGKYSHYKIPRKNVFARTSWLRHGGWWPDFQTRLINKNQFKSWPGRIHSTPVITGDTGYLKNPITHYFHGDLSAMVEKTAVFENIESDLLYSAGRPVTTGTFFRKYFAELYRRLLAKAGFLDGPSGIIEAIYQAYSKTITYLYLYEKKLKSRSL